ncbi:MAG TPA: hypothetical protein VJS44_14230 [Pyrinomonadaceae bacterium]|nr:hypothetical protein [Pyrinomonadaceae bacterium]
MKRIQMIALACLMLFMASSVYGQTRRRTTSGRRTRPASTRTQGPAVSSATVVTRVAEQIKSIGRFLYLYGPISKDLAANEAQAQQSAAVADTLQRNKAKLREAFHNYRVQMDELETTFSSSSELRPYYTKLLGVAASAAQAEDSVSASRYDQAGRSLLDVMNRLTDVLVDMQSR